MGVPPYLILSVEEISTAPTIRRRLQVLIDPLHEKQARDVLLDVCNQRQVKSSDVSWVFVWGDEGDVGRKPALARAAYVGAKAKGGFVPIALPNGEIVKARKGAVYLDYPKETS